MCSAGEESVNLTGLFHPSDNWLDGESELKNRYTLWRASSAGGRAISDAVATWKRLLADRGVIFAPGLFRARKIREACRCEVRSATGMCRYSPCEATAGERRGRGGHRAAATAVWRRRGSGNCRQASRDQECVRYERSTRRAQPRGAALFWLGRSASGTGKCSTGWAAPCLTHSVLPSPWVRSAQHRSLLHWCVSTLHTCVPSRALSGVCKSPVPWKLPSRTCGPPSHVYSRSKRQSLQRMCSVGTADVSVSALLHTSPAKLASKLGVQELSLIHI